MRLDATCGYKVMINDMRDAYWFVNIVYFFFFFFPSQVGSCEINIYRVIGYTL